MLFRSKKKKSSSGTPFWQDRDGSLLPWVRYAGAGLGGIVLLSFFVQPFLPSIILGGLGLLAFLVSIVWIWLTILQIKPTAAIMMLVLLPFGLTFIPGFEEEDRARLGPPFKLFLLSILLIGMGGAFIGIYGALVMGR